MTFYRAFGFKLFYKITLNHCFLIEQDGKAGRSSIILITGYFSSDREKSFQQGGRVYEKAGRGHDEFKGCPV